MNGSACSSISPFKLASACVLALTLTITTTAHAQELPNGGFLTGAIDSPGETDTYTFDAAEGEAIHISVADRSEDPIFGTSTIVYSPSGDFVDSSVGGVITFHAGESGTYTAEIEDSQPFADPLGEYDIYFVRAPGAMEGGQLQNSEKILESIDEGDLDSYVFDAAQGETILISVANRSADPTFATLTTVYDSGGKFVEKSVGGVLAFQVDQSGGFTVVVQDSQPFTTPAGEYDLYFVRAPGAMEGGHLPNGGFVSDVIEEGDLDSYVFDAVEESATHISIANKGDDPTFFTLVNVYDPSGNFVESSIDGAITFRAVRPGTYTVVVQDGQSFGTPAGEYDLYYVGVPGASEEGELASDSVVSGTIDLGDIDSYNFTAVQGDTVEVVVTDVSDTPFGPLVTVYGPAGELRGVSRSGQLILQELAAGVHTIVIQDQPSFSARTGVYTLEISSTTDQPPLDDAECPSLDASSIRSDPLVEEAIQEAWNRATSDGLEEHGFNIYQCYRVVSVVGQGQVLFETRIDWSVRSGRHEVEYAGLLPISECRLVGQAHTHPDDARDAIIDVPMIRDFGRLFEADPSPQDIETIEENGVPHFIIYKQGKNSETGPVVTKRIDPQELRVPRWECQQFPSSQDD